ncbi:MAG: MFS transporter [Alphaproteobacteria bacterium]|nr:MFS transporter [Alphaproteobacteria bacterium]MDX5370651.1 MFS transporter [Alphaproteobacteria bacterium]MDX5465088.1 MFS transporter [Alphaproteobacteria bacterium]
MTALAPDLDTRHLSPTAILLNIGHAMDHWMMVVFAYTWGVIAGVWGTEWTELTPYNYGALVMFGGGSIVSGRLGDLWGRWVMMVIFFAGMGASALVIALCTNAWQIGAALTLMGAFASIYHPVGIPMLVQKARKAGIVIGVNGLAGNMGIAIAAGVSVFIAERFGWQMAFILPGAICLLCAVAFVLLVPRETEAPARRANKLLDMPRAMMARVFAIMTLTAITGSVIFNFTTSGNGELLRAHVAEAAADPALLATMLFAIFAAASLAQIVVGKLIDAYPLKTVFLGVAALQVPLFLIAAQVEGWALFVVAIGFMLLVFGAVPFTDAMIVRYVDDRMRSRVTGMRLAIGYGVSSAAVALLGPSVKLAGFPTMLTLLAGLACVTFLAVMFLPADPPPPKE